MCRCWAVMHTRHSTSLCAFNASTTGASLMASGRVPKIAEILYIGPRVMKHWRHRASRCWRRPAQEQLERGRVPNPLDQALRPLKTTIRISLVPYRSEEHTSELQ